MRMPSISAAAFAAIATLGASVVVVPAQPAAATPGAKAPAWTRMSFYDGVDVAATSQLPMMKGLAGAYPLTLRLYTGCWGHALPVDRTSGTWDFNNVASQISFWNEHGIPMMVSLSYDPPITTEPPNPAAEAVPSPDWPALYASCAAAFAKRFGNLPQLRAIDVTNEPNIPNESTSDGAMPLVEEAIVNGVEAARQSLPAASYARVGFSWAYTNTPDPWDAAFFGSLGAIGGHRFARDTSFVDMHIYPGTWEPDYPPPGISPSNPDYVFYETRYTVSEGIAYLRRDLMPLAGLGKRVSIEIGETGYRSGGPGTTANQNAFGALPGNDQDQLQALYGEWIAAFEAAGTPGRGKGEGVRAFTWFRLADPYSAPSACAPPWPASGLLFNCTSGFGLIAQPSPGSFEARPSFCGYQTIIADPKLASSHPLKGIRGASTCTVTVSESST